MNTQAPGLAFQEWLHQHGYRVTVMRQTISATTPGYHYWWLEVVKDGLQSTIHCTINNGIMSVSLAGGIVKAANVNDPDFFEKLGCGEMGKTREL